MMRAAAICLCLLVLSVASASGHPGHEPPTGVRIWNDADGLFAIEGSFVSARDERIQLRKPDGSLVWVPLERLGASDRSWVKNRLDRIRVIDSIPGLRFQDEEVSAQTFEPAEAEPPRSFLLVWWWSFGILGIAMVGMAIWHKKKSAPILILLIPVACVAIGLAPAGPQEQAADPTYQPRRSDAAKHFEPFRGKLQLRSDKDFLFVGSNGLPEHPMMIGITAWQQQVPLPQPYTGANAWRIPLEPRLAARPISAKTALFRGAIALAINGVPIFNALNNRQEDAYLAGELDEFGGHCGRGDDYHYHMAPVHLEKMAGKGNPIAYALDGFPIYGYTDAEGKEPRDLDAFNGRMENGEYRYYSTRTYPYINGGMRGVVTVRGDQIEPQPRDSPMRPPGQPLRGAKIVDFIRDDEKKSYALRYELNGKTRSIDYTIRADNSATFVYTDGNGKSRTETYRRRDGGAGPQQKKDRPGPKKGS